jgi:cysteine-rich repeat protein
MISIAPLGAGAVTITSFDPPAASMGTVLVLEGAGFLGTTRVTFLPVADGRMVEAVFTVASDSQLQVTVPAILPRGRDGRIVITVFTADSAAVTVPCAGLAEVTSTTSDGRGGDMFLVRDGGVLTTGGGGNLYLVESGGIVLANGGGGTVFFVEDGGTVRSGGGINYLQSGASLQAGASICLQGFCFPAPSCDGRVIFGVGATIAPPCTANTTALLDLSFSARPAGCGPGSGLFTLLRPPLPVCGDGVIGFQEECDDANTSGGDGCSPTCLFEHCGNGLLDIGEACDDGNGRSGDGCDRCGVEPSPDADADQVPDFADNCVAVPNGPLEVGVPGVGFQTDTDHDGVGDACAPQTDNPAAAPDVVRDVDGDGEMDATDGCPHTPANTGVDAGGCALAEFCARVDAKGRRGAVQCRRADWRNDEPLGRPKDCTVARGSRGGAARRCAPR